MVDSRNLTEAAPRAAGLAAAAALAAAVVGVGAAGCRGTGGAGAAGATRLAIVFDDSFGQASLGGEAKRGAMLAVEEARGADFHAMYFGDAGAAEAAREAVAAVGFTDSDELRVAMPAFAAAGTPLVVAGATDPCLMMVPGAHLLEFACYSDPMQGAAMAEFAHERLAVRSAVVLFDARSEFANAVGSAFTTAMRGLPEGKASVVAFSGDMAGAVATALSGKPQAVYVAALPQDGPRLIEALRGAGFAGPVLGPDSFDEPAIFAAENLGKVFYSTHAWLAGKGDPAVETFVASYRRRFAGAEPTAFAALGYDATRTAIAAIARAQDSGVVSRATVGRALRELGAQDGVSGTIDPSSTEPFPRKAVWIVEASGGARSLASRWEPVKVPDPSCGKVR
jgi:branched-chain amino acid transport system substrate-binding protein